MIFACYEFPILMSLLYLMVWCISAFLISFFFLLIPKDMTRRNWIIVTWINVPMANPSESQHVSALRPPLPMLIGVKPPASRTHIPLRTNAVELPSQLPRLSVDYLLSTAANCRRSCLHHGVSSGRIRTNPRRHGRRGDRETVDGDQWEKKEIKGWISRRVSHRPV